MSKYFLYILQKLIHNIITSIIIKTEQIHGDTNGDTSGTKTKTKLTLTLALACWTAYTRLAKELGLYTWEAGAACGNAYDAACAQAA
jgi:hypothetical protein